MLVGTARDLRQAADMPLRLQCLCIDAADPDRLATFWAAALGWRRTHDGGSEVALEPPAGGVGDGLLPDLLFIQVPEDKAGKNRLHLDLRPGAEPAPGTPGDQAAEVARLEALGATRVDVGQPADVTWVVLADPEGNEFCVLDALSAADEAEVADSVAAWR